MMSYVVIFSFKAFLFINLLVKCNILINIIRDIPTPSVTITIQARVSAFPYMYRVLVSIQTIIVTYEVYMYVIQTDYAYERVSPCCALVYLTIELTNVKQQ
jgi:hypothetical protein